MGRVDSGAVARLADERWRADIVPALRDYIRIPNRSPSFDPEWATNGHMDAAVDLVVSWMKGVAPDGTELDVMRLPGRTPLIVVDVPATPGAQSATRTRGGDTVLLYGHLDKQPEMTGWRDGLSPWEPVLEGDKLYGRGAADDGYAAFAALTAIAAVREAGGEHARCVVLIEASEESGSPDLPAYVDALAERLGPVSLVVCLDSGCATYDRLWTTTSLRGLVQTELRVDIVVEGVHSGATGVVPSSFRILRSLLSRLEDEATGEIRLGALHVDIPDERRVAAAAAAAVVDFDPCAYPLVPGARTVAEDPAELILNRTWRPALAVTGASGLPALADAGNVLRPHTAVKLSIRIPPTCDPAVAAAAVEKSLTDDPPYGARVTLSDREEAPGWNAPTTEPWLADAVAAASDAYFGNPPGATGEGGTIPLMGMLSDRFPAAQFLVTGVLGPGSNAHGPNEFLHVPTARRLTCCVASVLDAHAHRNGA